MLLVVAVVASTLLVRGAGAGAVETDTFRLTPSPMLVQGLERRTFTFDLEPGEIAGDAVRIDNLTDEPRRFRVYGADAEVDDTGAVSVAPAARRAVGVGSWVALERSTLELGPEASEVVSFTVERPRDSGVEGVGAIVAEEIVDDPATGGISVAFRLALVIRLGGDVAGLRVGRPTMDPPLELFPSRSTATVELTNDTLQPVEASVDLTAGGVTGRVWELGEQHVRLDAGETRLVTAEWATVPRWGGLFTPAASVVWDGGSTVRTGPRALHPPLWLLALAILVIGVRGVRELRAGPRA